MIEREIVKSKIREFEIGEFINSNLKNVGHSHTKIQKTPLGEKVVIFTSRPGLIIGRRGQNISKLTKLLKKRFELENPQIEISEVREPYLDAQIVAEQIASQLERFGSSKFKGIIHQTLERVMEAGALGVEIRVSGKLPGSRARSWRVFSGYLKKCGDIALSQVKRAGATAQIKMGVIGVKVSITPPDIRLPDKATFKEEKEGKAGETAKTPETGAAESAGAEPDDSQHKNKNNNKGLPEEAR
ncbi:30S ribosomal protein S3 [Candidatus Woesearchaeota archaeon CG08_land_8_20_14_0_20_47_9]|nr:MAG: 30S ribosomal protein S3 [Candidatus Woesearchaeota archaeon CG1_02_47_18]PIO04165.1 MAG: 30S ribosomal protein S3 [Candidatus Woesearchaeota archaeon CG08_land_8_20_14_0_20_47_9]HII29779.1 30S ribosomal protein S3 [Candidatus Woesearchaeota archaeon]